MLTAQALPQERLKRQLLGKEHLPLQRQVLSLVSAAHVWTITAVCNLFQEIPHFLLATPPNPCTHMHIHAIKNILRNYYREGHMFSCVASLLCFTSKTLRSDSVCSWWEKKDQSTCGTPWAAGDLLSSRGVGDKRFMDFSPSWKCLSVHQCFSQPQDVHL